MPGRRNWRLETVDLLAKAPKMKARPWRNVMRLRLRTGVLSALLLSLGVVTAMYAAELADPYLWLEDVHGTKPLEWVQAHCSGHPVRAVPLEVEQPGGYRRPRWAAPR